MRILVTRPRPDAERTAEALRAKGIEAVVAPLLTVTPLVERLPDLSAYQAFVFTSANAVRVFADLGGDTARKVLTVGDATAAAARRAGFADVVSARGNAEDLAVLIADRIAPDDGPLAHLSGRDVAGDALAGLAGVGFRIDRHALYRADAAATLPAAAVTALRTRTIDGVALYSPRSARTFVGLIAQAGLGDACRRLTAFCLSDAVAGALDRPGTAVPWRRVAAAAAPTEADLIALIEQAAPATPSPRSPTMTAPILSNAEAIIAAFGGIRPMAKKLGVAVTTVQGWKERGTIPVARLDQIREAAAREGIDLADTAQAAETGAAETGAAKTEAADAGQATPSSEPGAAADSGAGAAAGADAAEPAAAEAKAERVEPGPAPGVKRAPDAAPPPIDHPARERSGWIRPFAFGAGVAIVLAVGIFLGWFLGPQRPGTASLDEQQQLAAAVKASTAKIADLDKQLAAARQTTAALRRRADAQEKRLAAAEKNAVAPAKIDRRLGPLRDRIAKLEGKVAKLPAGADGAAVARMRAATAALQKQLKSIEADLAKLSGSAAAKRVAALADRMAAVEKAVAGLRGRIDDAEAARTKLAARLAALSARVDKAALAGNRSAALVAAIGQVRTRALAGQPYAAALDVARGLAKDQPAIAGLLAKLADRAKTGVPTPTALAASFEPLAGRIVRAARTPADGNWFDRAWAKVRGSVTVRRVGPNVTGDSPEALVARAEAALGKGDLAGAVKLVAALPADARAPAEAWLARARARLAAEATSAALGRAALKLAGGQAVDRNKK